MWLLVCQTRLFIVLRKSVKVILHSDIYRQWSIQGITIYSNRQVERNGLCFYLIEQ